MKKQVCTTTLMASLAMLFAVSCADMGSKTLTSPSPALEPVVLAPSAPASATSAELKGCDVVQVERAGIKVETKCGAVRFNVPATVTLGSGYYNIWLPAINAGTKLGPFDYGVWSPWQSMEEGEYTYALAAETIAADGTIYQCDRHKGDFIIVCACVQPAAPKCEFGSAVYNPKDCTYACPPCVMPEPPECQFGPPQIDGCGWKCPPCVLPPMPQCQFGPPIGDMNSCTWSCPPCTVECQLPKVLDPEACACVCPKPGKPDCPEQVWDAETCSWVGDCYECDMSSLNPGCYAGNISTKQHFFDRFGICMRRSQKTGSQNRSCTPAKRSADAVVVKGGPQFRLYINVTKGQRLCTYCPASPLAEAACKKPDISHISYFVCDENATCR